MAHLNRDVTIAPELLALFHYARQHVTNDDIARCAPGDPGTPDYIARWQSIRKSGQPPLQSDFDVTEVIGLTCYTTPPPGDDGRRFRRFRAFTSCVGAILLWRGEGPYVVCAPNYLVLRLLEDQIALADKELG